MYKIFIISLLLLLHPIVQADNISQRLKRADGYRQNGESVRIEMEVKLYKQNNLHKTRRYSVYVGSQRRSLVLFRSVSELGQKVLMRDDQFHMFMPKSRRAIRITPLQKLLGEASTGDVANMTWHEDYTPRLLKDNETANGVSCRILELTSRRKGSTYDRIELYLERQSDAPVYARLYLRSGKLAKEASYEMGEIDGNRMVIGMTLQDAIKPGRSTHIKYLSMTAIDIPAHYFNPQYLARNTVK